VPFVAEGQAQNKELPNVPLLGASEEWRKRDWVYTLHGGFSTRGTCARKSRVCLLVKPGGWVHKPFWAQLHDGHLLRRHSWHCWWQHRCNWMEFCG